MIKKNTIEQYTETLNKLAYEIESSLLEAEMAAALLTMHPQVSSLLFYRGKLELPVYGDLNDIRSLLIRFRASSSLIYTSYIFIRDNNLVISSDGSMELDYFLNKYDRTYNSSENPFEKNKSGSSNVEILSVSKIKTNNEKISANVIPYICYRIEDNYFYNPIVIEFSVEKIKDKLNEFALTKNSYLTIEDSFNSININNYQDQNPEISPGIDVSISPRENIIGNWTYSVHVPYADFLYPFIKQIIFPFIIIIMGLIVSIYLVYLFTGKIYTPIRKILEALSVSNTSQDRKVGDLDFLNNQVKEILVANSRMKKEINQVFPFVCERYLLSILNSNNLFNEKELKKFLTEHGFKFDNSNYSVILTSVHFTKNFYSHYSSEDKSNICHKILLTSGDIPNPDIKTYSLFIGTDQVCTILNIKNQIDQKEIIEYVDFFHKKLELDKNYIRVTSGISNVYSELIGLHTAFKEAKKASTLVYSSSSENFGVYRNDGVHEYTLYKENKLFNFLLSGNQNSVNKLLDELLLRNINDENQETEWRLLFLQMYNTGIRALEVKNITESELMDRDILDIQSCVDSSKRIELYNYIKLFFENILEKGGVFSGNNSFNEIKKYIDENYCSDIYLDKIGEKFDITAKYASKLIKKELGMPFQKYISRLRISKAKEFLTETELTINEISQKTGFNSRHPFLRTFKQYEGITPSEYRSIIESNQF